MDSSFELRSDIRKDVPIFFLTGDITGEVEDVLMKSYDELKSADDSRLVLDFSNTKYINSSGIAILIQLITTATEKGQKVEFAAMSSHFRKVMDIVGLTDFVRMFDTLEEAISADS